MRRWLATAGLAALCIAPLRADVTISQTMTVEGGAAAMMGGAMKPVVVVTRVKGTKARGDMEVMDMKMSTLTDIAKKEVVILNHAQKTALVLSPTSPMPQAPMPSIAATFKPTGQSKAIEGNQCDEHAFTATIGFAEMSGGQMPPEAAAMMKDVRIVMNGSVWIAKTGPGAAEYMAFQKAAVEANLGGALAGALGAGQKGGLDKLMEAVTSAPGMPYLTEMTMTFEGTGPIVEMMKTKMSGTKMTQRTTAVSTEAIADDQFDVPADYKVEKK